MMPKIDRVELYEGAKTEPFTWRGPWRLASRASVCSKSGVAVTIKY